MFCTHCAAQLAPNARFCSTCGAPQSLQALAPIRPAALVVDPHGAVLPVRQEPLAVAALSFSIAAWLVLPVVGAIAAVVLGHLARARMRKNPGLGGSGFALTALIVGYAHLALLCLGLSAIAGLWVHFAGPILEQLSVTS